MATRDRRRGSRQKRKARSAERRREMAARSEEQNRAAREALEPLAPDERPPVVTAAAVISAGVAVSVVIAYLAGANVNGDRPNPVQVMVPALLMAVMSVGMWRVRYWAVLGFQAVLALLIVAATIGLIGATSGAQVAGNVGLIAVCGVLFYFMIRAMARIQMPERRPPQG